MKKLTFTGIDASLEISLLEYGLIISNEQDEDGSGSHFAVYRQGDDYGCGHVYPNDIDGIVKGSEWANSKDIKSFLSFIGSTKKAWLTLPLVTKISDLISYFGSENIIGMDYYPMSEEEVTKRYL